jgi:hypothetical protein
MQPSQPGYDLTTADVQNASLPQDVLQRMIAPVVADPGGASMEELIAAMLAQMALGQNVVQNCRYRVVPFQFTTDNTEQQLLPENPYRKVLIIHANGNSDKPALPLLIKFGSGPLALSALPLPVDPNYVRLDVANIYNSDYYSNDGLNSVAEGANVLINRPYVFSPAPSSAITLAMRNVGGSIRGRIIEGI